MSRSPGQTQSAHRPPPLYSLLLAGLAAMTGCSSGFDDKALMDWATSCRDGDFQACDDLFIHAEPGSDLENTGYTCGDRVQGSQVSGSCEEMFGTTGDPLDDLEHRCQDGDFLACDELYYIAEPESGRYRVAITCGELVAADEERTMLCAELDPAAQITASAAMVSVDAQVEERASLAEAEPTTTTTVSSAAFSTDTQPKVGPVVGAGPTVEMVAAASEIHPGFDRFKLEFAGLHPPAYDVHYDEAGALIIVVGATAAGPPSDLVEVIQPGLRLENATLNIDDEGTMVWTLAIDGNPGFEVSTVDGPNRLFVDVSHS